MSGGDATAAEARRMYEAGWSLNEVGTAFGVRAQAAGQMVRAAGGTTRKPNNQPARDPDGPCLVTVVFPDGVDATGRAALAAVVAGLGGRIAPEREGSGGPVGNKPAADDKADAKPDRKPEASDGTPVGPGDGQVGTDAAPWPDGGLEDADWLREEYLGWGRTMADIAEQVGVGLSTVRRALYRHGIPIRRPGPAGSTAPGYFPMLRDRGWLEEQYIGQGRPMREIAADVGCSAAAVGMALQRHRIMSRAASGDSPHRQLNDPEWLTERYTRRGLPRSEIAEEVGCAVGAVTRALARFGIAEHDPYPQLADPDWVAARRAEGMRVARIAEEVGCDVAAVSAAIARHGLVEDEPPRRRERPRSYPRLQDADWLREQHHDLGRSMKQIADEVGTWGPVVRRALQVHGIEVRLHPDRTHQRLDDVAWLTDLYVEQRLSQTAIAEKVGCSVYAVSAAIARHGIEQPARFPELDDRDWLLEQLDNGLTNAEIADVVGCCRSTVERGLDRHGLVDRRRFKQSELNDADWLRNRHDGGRVSLGQIAEGLGVATSTVSRAFRRHGVEVVKSRPVTIPRLDDREWLQVEYLEKYRSMAEIADDVGCSRDAVGRALRIHGIPTRTGRRRVDRLRKVRGGKADDVGTA